jgi:hypothetical protein
MVVLIMNQKSKKKKKKGNIIPGDGGPAIQDGNEPTGSRTPIAEAEPNVTVHSASSPPGSASKKEWKARKKQKAKEKREESDDFERALDKLSFE